MWEPFVSILVPVRNEERYIERCLYSIARQDYPRSRFEVLVIDGQSDRPDEAHRQPLRRRVDGRSAAAAEPALSHRRRHEHRAGGGARRGHRPRRRARIDRSPTSSAGASRRCTRPARTASAASSRARATPTWGARSRWRCRHASASAARRSAPAAKAPSIRSRSAPIAARSSTASAALPRTSTRVRTTNSTTACVDHGGTIMLVPGIRARYTVRGDLRCALAAVHRLRAGEAGGAAASSGAGAARQLVPAAFVAALCASTIAAILGRRGPLAGLLAVYTGAATIASLALVPRHGWRHVPPLPVVFSCLHLAYGFGFIAGCVGLSGRILTRSARGRVRLSPDTTNSRAGGA